MCCVFHAYCYFNGTLQNFFVLKKIPGTFVLKRYKRKISKLEKDTRFFNSASVLLNFFTNRASNVTYVLLNKYKHCQLRHFLYFLYFCPCLELGLLMSYLCDFFSVSSSFSLWLIVSSHEYKHTCSFAYFLRKCPIILGR